jgi:hypothetical protein
VLSLSPVGAGILIVFPSMMRLGSVILFAFAISHIPTPFIMASFSSVSPDLTMTAVVDVGEDAEEVLDAVSDIVTEAERTEVAKVVGTAVDAKTKEVDSSVGSAVVFAVELDI